MRVRCVCLAAVLGLGLVGCSEDQPATGPTIHCFNQQTRQWEERPITLGASVSTGKTTVNCPVGE